MTLKDAMLTDASTVFCAVDDFAEAVTYYPHRYYGAVARVDRTINAVVIREPTSILGEDGDTVAKEWEVHVVNSTTLGISSDELDIGGDQLGFAPRLGETAERRSIVRVVGHDEGMVVIVCR